ncbi:MAG: DUF4062 domain-containing protein, partial [Gammaproteobacteria bacterium]
MKPLRIYLSSTYEDLKQHRAAVFEALEKAGLPVARMEGYVASDKRPLDLCLQDVAQSDIYVGLFAWRYGYVPPPEHGNPDGRSITELEYRHAMDKGKPILTFLADPSTEAVWPERFRDEKTGDGDCGARLKALKTNLGVEKTASFFTNPHHLASLILAAIFRQPMVKRPFMAPALRAGFVPRPEKAARLREALLSAGDSSVATTAIEGGGGFGKTTLAIHLCHDPEIIKAFPDGILWATFGQNPDLKVELTAIFAALTDERPVFAGVDDAKRSVAEKLESRRYLLVVDDVWSDSHLEPLQEVGAAGVLYTTRRRDLDTKAASVEIDEMSRDEAASLLAHDLPLSQDLRPKLAEFAAELGNWPLLLALANARIRSELKQRGALQNAFARVSEVYRRRGVTGFDSHNAEKREEAVRLSVSAGLESFDDRFRERATGIGLFPEDVPVPVQVLADLWTCGVFEAEEDVLQHLHNLRVVTWDRNANTVTVHDMIRAALASHVSDRASQHAKLLDAWGDPRSLPHAYAWHWIGYHLHGAGRQAELEALLLDLDWLRAKLDATEIDALVREFGYASESSPLRNLRDALRLSSHLLAKSKSQLPGQLLARLPESEGSLRQSILERASRTREPWLRPLRPSLTAPGGPLVRTLEGHADSVRAVALTPDGTRAVSSYDHTLKVWDLESGRELRTLEGH